MGEEKEKERYWGKGYKNLHWIQFVYMLDKLTICFIKTRIFSHKAFIFNHYFSNFNALFLYTCPGVSVSVYVSVSDSVPPKNIIASQIRTNKGFERVRQVYRFRFTFRS